MKDIIHRVNYVILALVFMLEFGIAFSLLFRPNEPTDQQQLEIVISFFSIVMCSMSAAEAQRGSREDDVSY